MNETMGGFPLLTVYTFAPVLGMAIVLLLPSRRADIIKTVAAAAAAVPMLIGLYVLFTFRDDGRMHYTETLLWVDGLNVYYKLGMDGISAPMIVLSGMVGFVAVIASWGIEKQIKGYFALILLLLAGMNGVFCALDFFLFYVFWELMLLPMYFLIGVWGGPNRVYAAIKFFLYTLSGSVLMLVVLLASWYWSDGRYAATPSEAAALTNIRANVMDRRAAAFDALCEKARTANDPDTAVDDLAKLPREARRQIYAAYRISWDGDALDSNAPAYTPRVLASAKRIQNAVNNLPPTRDGDKAAAEAERATLLAGISLERTFDLEELKERFELFLCDFQLFKFLPPQSLAMVMFVFLYVAFAIKVPVFPFHTWLPWAHVEAPTAISVILAGILLKMGVYGFLRISFGLCPTMAVYFAVPMAVMGVFNIIYGACCAMAQDDMKKLVAYSSVSHMGFCMLGLAALTKWGMTGAVLQMFNHGTSTSMMFLLVGVIYDRAHHRDINRFGGLAAALPKYAAVMTLALFASMGLPGLSGFISEVLVFLGAFQSRMGEYSHPNYAFQSMTLIAVVGVILTAAYLLWMMQRVFFGPLNEKYKDFPDLDARETFTLAPLAVMVVVFGVYPQPLLDLTVPSVTRLQEFVLKSRDIKSAEVGLDGGAGADAHAQGRGLERGTGQEPGALAGMPPIQGTAAGSAAGVAARATSAGTAEADGAEQAAPDHDTRQGR